MLTKTKSFFKRLLGTVLSAACLVSGTAAAGTIAGAVAATTAPEAAAAASPSDFSWDNATVYFLLTDRFKNGDTSNDHAYNRKPFNGDNRASFHGGDFAGITQEIEAGYFDDLGVNAIWLTAPYEQIHGYIQGGSDFGHYSYHGYYVLDYTETDAAYGTKEEFRTLVDTAHKHGIRVIMDIVMNHAGYNSMYDMNEYGYGTLLSGWEDAYNNENLAEYHDYIDYTNSDDSWSKWWGYNWIRCGINGFVEPGGDDKTRCLAALPDFVTESTAQVGIPPLLQTKWTMEGTLAAKQSKYGTSDTVTGFITSWLSDWVREYGVDGFRCDTAKHVDLASWNTLKTKCTAALKEWKQNNPTKKLDDLDFWMTGECWDWNIGWGKDGYFTQGGFDSMINFQTQGGGMVSQAMVANTYANYANSINKVDGFNGLSYVSSHDSTLARPSDMYALGSAFLLLPGAVQIYYGDETARPYVEGIPQDGNGGAGHSLRSDMPWSSLDTALVKHWGIVGRFRQNHIAVGAGANVGLTASSGVGFGRTYDKNGLTDKVAGVIYASANASVTLDVSALWADGTMLTNFYDDSIAIVSGGKVTFNAGAHGTILISEPDGTKGRVTVKHINQDTGATIKTETLSGLVGDNYSTSPLTQEGYTVTKTEGKTTGVYSETDVTVTYYYTFDSANYGYVTVKHVDAASGAEIAKSETNAAKIGTSYSVSPADIKDYEVDLSKTSNATGTVKKGTTTVTFYYIYVEPTNLRVHYYNANGWSTVRIYAYDESGATVKEYTGAWKSAKEMTAEGDGWFVADVPDTESAKVIFHNGSGVQEPAGAGTPGYDCSGEVWLKNGKKMTAGKVNVVYSSTDGKVLGTEKLTGLSGESYNTTAKTFTGYTLSSTPANASGTFTEATITVTYVYKPNSVSALTNSSKLSASSVALGGSVTVNCAASGGKAPYQYAVYYKKSTSTSYRTVQAYKTNKTITITPAVATTYDVRVKVKDSAGTVKTKDFTVKVTAEQLKNTSTLSATSITLGKSITITGKATGGTTPYKYAAYYKKATTTTYHKIRDYSTNATMTVTPAVATNYDVRVKVKDASGKVINKDFTVKVSKASTTALTN